MKQICKQTGKVIFATRSEADHVAQRPKRNRTAVSKNKSHKNIRGLRPYRCEFCREWHVAASVKHKKRTK